MGAGQSLWMGRVINMLVLYVHGRAQPVGKLMTRDALQLIAEFPEGRWFSTQDSFFTDAAARLHWSVD